MAKGKSSTGGKKDAGMLPMSGKGIKQMEKNMKKCKGGKGK